ncbi:lipopolysaccharide biosynthesis protein [Corticibacterium sp. UT-5YL-CI-8]|nr:lipopolysaccharide biosynthesis protein [Tianweitania sp. UT-5YL-CI-8]
MTEKHAAGRLRRLLPMAMSYMASGGSLIVASAAQLITFAILARFLGVEEFGLYVAVTAVTAIAIHLCGLGATECLVRRVARDKTMYPIMLGHNIILTVVSSVVLVVIGLIVLPYFYPLSSDMTINVGATLLLLLTNIPLVRGILLTEQIFLGHSDFRSANKIVLSFGLARTAAAALACLVFGVNTIAEWVVWQFLCHVIVAAGCVYSLRNLGRPKYGIVSEEIKQGLYFSIPFIIRAVRQNADLLILALVTAPEIVGSYSVARRILESSYLSVEAMNRLIYPGSARASMNGLHGAMGLVRRVALAAVGISAATAVTVFICAPLLPLLFGQQYVSMVDFVRILCWVVVPMAMWAIAVEALGAAGHHAVRATVMGGGSLVGAALTAWATWYAPPTGTFISFYLIEFMMVGISWAVLLKLARTSRAQAPEPMVEVPVEQGKGA